MIAVLLRREAGSEAGSRRACAKVFVSGRTEEPSLPTFEKTREPAACPEPSAEPGHERSFGLARVREGFCVRQDDEEPSLPTFERTREPAGGPEPSAEPGHERSFGLARVRDGFCVRQDRGTELAHLRENERTGSMPRAEC